MSMQIHGKSCSHSLLDRKSAAATKPLQFEWACYLLLRPLLTPWVWKSLYGAKSAESLRATWTQASACSVSHRGARFTPTQRRWASTRRSWITAEPRHRKVRLRAAAGPVRYRWWKNDCGLFQLLNNAVDSPQMRLLSWHMQLSITQHGGGIIDKETRWSIIAEQLPPTNVKQVFPDFVSSFYRRIWKEEEQLGWWQDR